MDYKKSRSQKDIWEFHEEEKTISFIWDDEEEINYLYETLRAKNLELNDLDRIPDTVKELHELLLAVEADDSGDSSELDDLTDGYCEMLFVESYDNPKCEVKEEFDIEPYPEDGIVEFDDLSWHDMTTRERAEKDRFEVMWPAVKTMCESLIHEPHKWEFGDRTFKLKGTKLEYWCSSHDDFPVTEIFCNGKDTSMRNQKVFSTEQGRRIGEALTLAKRRQYRPEQGLVLQSLGLLGNRVVDERNGVLPANMSFWRRLLFLFTGHVLK